MNNRLTKYALTALMAGASTATLPMGFKASFDYDGEEVKVNGRNINDPSLGYGLTGLALGVGGAYLGSHLAKNKDFQTKITAALAGGTIGSIVADAIYGRATRRTIFEKTGVAAGTLAGTIYPKNNAYIKDSAALGGHIGGFFISQVYGDTEKAKLYLGSAVGEQAGMCLVPDSKKEIGRALGVNIGAALSAPQFRYYYLKKALIQPISVEVLKRSMESVTNKIVASGEIGVDDVAKLQGKAAAIITDLIIRP